MSGRAYLYLTRIIPALSTIAVATLLVFSFIVEPAGESDPEHHGEATPWQLALSAYTVFLHVLSIMFPARVCWAMGNVTRQMKEVAERWEGGGEGEKGRMIEKEQKAEKASSPPGPLFVVIIPAYKEEMETLEETLRVLASHPQALRAYHVYLAMEEKEGEATFKAKCLIKTFDRSFFKMSYTIHPTGIPGEAQGKSSNESWAGKQACRDYAGEDKREIVMTTMDADTHLSTRYFYEIARLHRQHAETNATTMYVPPLVFDRNLHHVPLPVRTADLMWAGAGLSSLYPGSAICIPTSVYSLPMVLVERVGGWDTGPGAIGEDMHMYLKCFFALSGNLDVRIVYAAASQCNVSSNVKGFAGYLDGLKARYRQALRHMWGSLDTGFAIRETISMVAKHYRASRPTTKKPSTLLELATHIAHTLLNSLSALFHTPTTTTHPPAHIHLTNLTTLTHRLFEAHFLPIHLALILTTSTLHSLLTTHPVPPTLALALNFSGLCRLTGWTLMVIYFLRYARYHSLCLGLREHEMRAAGLHGEMEARGGFSRRVFVVAGWVEAGLFPVGGFVFGAIPAAHAVLGHLFTERLTYQVSLKPQLRALKGWRGGKVAGEEGGWDEGVSAAGAAEQQLSGKSAVAQHVARCPSDQWRKQAMSRFDHVTTAMRFNRPVQGED